MNFSAISILFTDFDGVWTDNTVNVNSNGTESVTCSKYDSLGLTLMRKARVPVVVISSEVNEVVQVRCDKLDIECYKSVINKIEVIENICERHKISPETAGFVGNDLNDIPALQFVGFPICVADAVQEVKLISEFVSRFNGGNGALREIFEKIYKAKV